MTIAHIANNELGFDVRTKLNDVIDIANASGGGGGGMAIGGAITSATAGSVLFAGTAGVLAQDNTNFFWNATTKDLRIGGAYYVGASRALYVVSHGSGNNWFAGAAGNPAATGYNNFAAGNAALAALTSGYENVAVGNNAAKVLTSGYDNFALGANALLCALTEPYNTAIGATALQQLGNAGAGGGGSQSNVAIGFAAMNQMESGSGNIGIGYNALSNVVAPTAANWNVVIGHQAGNGLGSGGGGTVQYNTMIGNEAAKNLVGASTRNTWIGAYKGPSATMSNTIAISEGAGNLALLDFHVTGPFTWSISSPPSLGIPPGLQIYNVQDALGTPANYERAVLDWCSAPYTASNIFLIDTQRAGTGVKRNIAIGGLPKAGAPAAGDLPSGTFSLIDDTSASQTWLVFNKAGTLRKVQLT